MGVWRQALPNLEAKDSLRCIARWQWGVVENDRCIRLVLGRIGLRNKDPGAEERRRWRGVDMVLLSSAIGSFKVSLYK